MKGCRLTRLPTDRVHDRYDSCLFKVELGELANEVSIVGGLPPPFPEPPSGPRSSFCVVTHYSDAGLRLRLQGYLETVLVR